MTHTSDQTIFALASAPGAAGVAVMRISGPKAYDIALRITGRNDLVVRQATYTHVINPITGAIIDQAVVTFFKGPKSYTGEDTIELTLHGSMAVIHQMNDVLSSFDTCRMAEAGEFTKRAFMNGKLDLTAAEAVNDLIYAETEAQRALAVDQLGGSLVGLYDDWTDRLSRLLAHQEAEIEFPDEDMPDGVDDIVRQGVIDLLQELSDHLNDNNRGERMRSGLQIAIIGAPNAGKSSLLNALARRDAAIVSDIAGTTRDIVEVPLNLGGYPVVLCDTAGLRDDHSDAIEAEGIKRAIARAEDADIIIALLDATTAPDFDGATLKVINDKTHVVLNKMDTVPNRFDRLSVSSQFESTSFVSCLTDEGLKDFLDVLTNKAKNFFDAGSHAPVLTRARHRGNLKICHDHLKACLDIDLPELAAEDLRQALMSLGRITGKVDVEQLLDIVFRDFCIGK